MVTDRRGGKESRAVLSAIIPVDVKNQREVEARQDVLVYTGEPMEKPLEITGPVKSRSGSQ